MEPFQKSQQRTWPLFHFVRTELEANRGVSGGASHKFNAICHGRETAEIGLSPETAEIVCNALTSCAEVNYWVAVRRTYVFTLQEVEKICRTLQSHVILVWTIRSQTASCFKLQVAIFQLRSFYKLNKGFSCFE